MTMEARQKAEEHARQADELLAEADKTRTP
jgi:hypothetical protein